jgi:hypothetical protein
MSGWGKKTGEMHDALVVNWHVGAVGGVGLVMLRNMIRLPDESEDVPSAMCASLDRNWFNFCWRSASSPRPQ